MSQIPQNKPVLNSSTPPPGAQVCQLNDKEDLLVQEKPLLLKVHELELLTLRTPQGEQSDKDWALGFLAGEGIIQDLSEVRSISFIPATQRSESQPENFEAIPDRVEISLWQSLPDKALGLLKRTHEIRASCGLCGVQSARDLLANVKKPSLQRPKLPLSQIPELMKSLRLHQFLFQATGGCHGSAIIRTDGEIVAIAEDIGRHNALDKVIGMCLRKGVYFDKCIALLSGRAGYELIIKCQRLGIPIILSVGAASTFALELAQEGGTTLIGFIRNTTVKNASSMNIYSDFGRILMDQ